LYVHLTYKQQEIMETKLERIDIRLSKQDKELLKRAQLLSGDKSASSFIVRVMKEQANKIVDRHECIVASEKDRKTFFKTVYSETAPNSNLIEAALKYKANA